MHLEYSLEGLDLPGGETGKFPHLSKGPCFSFRNFPSVTDTLLLLPSSLLLQLCFAMAFPPAPPSLCCAGLGFAGVFGLPFPGRLPSRGEPRDVPLDWSPWAGGGWCHLALWGHPADGSGSGAGCGAGAEITARSLGDALCISLLPSLPSKILIQTGA